MQSLLRRAALGVLTLAVMAAAAGPASAQKDKDKKDDVPDSVLSFSTSDGVALGAMWMPAKDKPGADAVMMFPRPGAPVTKQWIELAEAMSAKGFAVLLFDFRGSGMNGPAPKAKEPIPDPFYIKGRGERIITDVNQFFNEPFNRAAFGSSRKTIENVGLNWKTFGDRAKDVVFNDLLAARFFLDKKNDAKVCNTNRIWIVTEKEGYQVALAHIAFEAHRYTIFPEQNVAAVQDQTRAAKDYAGIVCFSPNENFPIATQQVTKGFANKTKLDVRTAVEHLDRRMAIVAVYGKSEGPGKSKAIVNKVMALNPAGTGPATEEELKRRFKYFIEIDNSKVKGTPLGIDLIDATDSLGVKTAVVDRVSDIAKVGQDFGKEDTKRNADATKVIPRSPIMNSR